MAGDWSAGDSAKDVGEAVEGWGEGVAQRLKEAGKVFGT